MSEQDDDLIQYLVDMGIIVPLGYSEEIGQDMYKITDKAQNVFPEIVEQQTSYVNDAVFDLWNLELIDVVFDENGDALVGLNKNSLDRGKVESIENEDLKKSMYAILIAFAERFGHDI